MSEKIIKIGQIPPLKGVITDKTKYFALDIETFKFNENELPYAIGVYGKKKTKFKIMHINEYIKGGESCDELLNLSKVMISDMIKYLLSLYKGNVYIYAHNFGSFDGYFILKSLIEIAKLEDIKYIIDDTNRIIELKYKNLIFRDSFRIFPASLKMLGSICKLKENKMEFNYNIGIDEIITKEHEIKAIRYLTNDLIMLYEIIFKFSNDLINDYNIRLSSVYSTSNLAFRVFRTKFLTSDKNLYSSNIHEYKLIKPSYFGGSVEVFERFGRNLFYYDVNSLYPYVMLNPMPIKYLSTVNTATDEFIREDMFGFVDCKIYIPYNEYNPQVPVRTKDGLTYPTGLIQGIYFSEEVKSWIKLGYDVELIRVHLFSKELDLFKDYVEYFYKLKADKTHENKRFLNKLMLNGLYGYFGRQIRYDITKIMKLSELKDDKCIKYSNIIQLNDDTVYVKYELEYENSDINDIWKSIDESTDFYNMANIAISAAITSYARIHMQQYKLIPNNKCYYSDTDSIILEKELETGISGEIGDLKLEYQIEEAIFIRPKLYGIKTKCGKEIIKAAGFPKDSINYEDLNNMLHDSSYVKAINTFNIIKSMTGLNLRGSRLIKMLRIK